MALDKITHITGKGVYLAGDDVDTDRIIPARFMKCVTFDGLGEYMFYDVRHNEDGSPKNHILNDPRYAEASILAGGANFGCGSSREHAPQAMVRYGIRAVIAESFAEIFYGNATSLGMPCVRMNKRHIEQLAAVLEQKPETEIAIDLESERVTFADKTFSVDMEPSAKDALTRGRWDPIGELLENDAAISRTVENLTYMK